ncbi:MAG TPA: PAS domain S-box protein [Bryobacteraceae bacterium]|nr:PAS domain S-box protein [Bryobacteraceae bacterium]
MLHSYYKGYRWTDDENRGIESVLLPAIGAANLYIEYMDTKRFYTRESLEEFPEIYRRKFRWHHFDAIVATDNNAFDFLRAYRDRLFPGTPVIFCGVNYFRDEDLQGHSLFTGVSEEADVKDTLDVALSLHPATRHIYVVNELTETGQTVHDEIVRLLPGYRQRVGFTFLEDLAMAELENRLRHLPPESLVFYSFLSRDHTGRYFQYDEAATAITRASNAPVYGAWDFNLGLGIVGGKLISGFFQGETAGRMALRVLEGENPDAMPVVRFSAERPNRYMFDYRQLRRWGIPLNRLPAGSIVVNRPVSFFSRYWTVLLSGGACLLLIGINSLLYLNIRRRRAAERTLWEQQEHLEDLVTSRAAQLENLNSRLRLDIRKREATEKALRQSQELLNKTFASLRDALLIVAAENRIIMDCNPAATKLFGFAREELVGHSVRLLHVDEAAFLGFRETALDAVRRKGYLRLQHFSMRRKNGEVFATQQSVMPLYNESGELTSWVSVIRDITEENRKEEKLEQYRRKLRALAAELTVVEARERRAIAAQLHENLGQLLATAKMKIAPLRTAVAGPAEERAAEVQGLVEEALQQTRSLTYQLSPPILYQLGLEAGLKWLAENAAKQYGFRVHFTRLGESATLEEETSVFLYSAVRELLVNVAKHAQAHSVDLRLRWFEDSVEVLVHDDGRGFASHVAADGSGVSESPNGFGLFNIQERSGDLGGRLRLRSEPGKGTAVKIRLPLGGARAVEIEHEHSYSVGR